MERDWLLGMMAVQLGLATAQQVMAAASASLADGSRSLAERLRADGVLADDRLAMLEALVGEALKAHGGDVARATETLGGQRVLQATFGTTLRPSGPGVPGLDATVKRETPAGPAEDRAVTSEAPGRYRGGRGEIGRGGIGRVLVAFDEHVGREVAVKELIGDGESPSVDADLTALAARFLREARVTGQLEHPNIIPVYEIGRRAGGTLYYTMKLVRGRTLAAALAACKSLEERLLLLPHYVDLCNAIAYAHSRNVVHRDIKTDNVMVGEFGETVVLDWGLAKVKGTRDVGFRDLERDLRLFQEARGGQTVDGAAIGTPAYMPPEQAAGTLAEVDERSDVWSLGAVLFEILTGQAPFAGSSAYEIMGKVLRDPVRSPRLLEPGVPPELAAIALKALRRDKQERYESAARLTADVQGFVSGGRISAYTFGPLELIRRFVRHNRALSAALLTILVVILVSSALLFRAYRRAEEGEREAHWRLAAAYTEKARRLVQERAFGPAKVFATAAALNSPAVPGADFNPRMPAAELAAQRADLQSLLYGIAVGRRLLFDAELPLDGAAGGASAEAEIVFSPDGRRLYAGAPGQVRAWSLPDRALLKRLDRPDRTSAPSLALSPDGRTLVVSGDVNAVEAWDVENWTLRWRLDGRGTVAFAPSGRWLVVAGDGPARVVDAADGSPRSPLPEGCVRVAVSPDERLLACGAGDGRVWLIDAKSLAVERTLEVSSGTVLSLAFAADSRRLVTSTVDGRIRVWALPGGDLAQTLPDGPGASMGFSPDGALLAGLVPGGLRLWDAATGRIVETVPARRAEAHPAAVAFGPDGRLVAVLDGGLGVVELWRLPPRSGMRLPTTSAATAARFSHDGRRVAFATEGAIALVDAASGAPLGPVGAHENGSQAWALAFLPGDTRLISMGGDRLLREWDLPGRKVEWSARVCEESVVGDALLKMGVSPDRKTVAAPCVDNLVKVWEIGRAEPIASLSADFTEPKVATFSPDGARLAAADAAGRLAVWDTRGWTLRYRLGRAHGGAIATLAFSPDSATLASAGADGVVRLWDAARGTAARTLRGHRRGVNEVRFSADGRWILSGSDDDTARLWEARSGELQQTLTFEESVASVEFAPDDTSYLVGAETFVGTFPVLRELWRQPAKEALEGALREAGRTAEILGGATSVEPPAEPPARPGSPEALEVLVRDSAGAEGAARDVEVEALDPGTAQPLDPRVVARTDSEGRAALVLPRGISEVALRTRSPGAIDGYHFSPTLRPGARDVDLRVYLRSTFSSGRQKLGLEVRAGLVQLWGSVSFGSLRDAGSYVPVGCARVTVDPAAPVTYREPPLGLVSVSRTSLHPGAPLFDIQNLPLGAALIRAEASGRAVERRLPALPAGSVAYVGLWFDLAEGPDPTPRGCR